MRRPEAHAKLAAAATRHPVPAGFLARCSDVLEPQSRA